MAITVQARQADGTWAVRNAFITENKAVLAGSMNAADLEAKARKLMSQWQQTMQDGRQLRVHNSDNDTKPSANTEKTYGALKVTEREYQAARKVANHGTGILSEGAYQVVRYCKGQPFYLDEAKAFIRALRTTPMEAA